MGRKRIFLDLDGVLADLVGGAARIHNKSISLVTCYGLGKCWDMEESKVWEPLGYDFWANLELTPEAHQIVSMCEREVGAESVGILTSPCSTDGCMDGKRAWLRKHFPQFVKRALIGSPKYFCATPLSLLIDDSDYKVKEFWEHGGLTFLFPRPWNEARDKSYDPLGHLREALYDFRKYGRPAI